LSPSTPLRVGRIRTASAYRVKSAHAPMRPVGASLIWGAPWLAILGLAIAALQGWIAWSQKRVADQQTAIAAQQTAVAVGERIDKLSAQALQTKQLLGQLRRLQVALLVPVYSRTCSTNAQCSADVMKAFETPGRRTKNKWAETEAKTANELLRRSFDSHILFAQVFLANAYEAPFDHQREQARALVTEVIRPSILLCEFKNSSGSELVSAIDTVTHLSSAALSAQNEKRLTYIASMVKLRANFGVAAASPEEPYPMREYILDIRRMYSVLDRVPLALANQCEAANTFIEREKARLISETGTTIGQSIPTVPECPHDDKCGGLVSVEFYWHPADGCRRMNDPGRGNIGPPALKSSRPSSEERC